MKIRHVYSKGLITNAKEEQNNKQRQFSADSFFRQLSSRNDFVNNNAIFVIINVHVAKQTNQYSKGEIKTVFEWFRIDSKILHIVRFIQEHFDFDASKYNLRNEDNNVIYRDLNETIPNQDRIIFSYELEKG